MKRKFVINKYKGYSIRNHYFVAQPNGGCMLETDDEEVIRLVEGADGYGVFIHPAETAEEIEAMKKKDGRKVKLEGPTLEKMGEGLNELAETSGYAFHDDVVAPPPIATQGARGTQAGKPQRKSQFITTREK